MTICLPRESRIPRRLAVSGLALVAAGMTTGTAHAQFLLLDGGYVGPAYLQVPGIQGDARQPEHKSWIRTESHQWKASEEMKKAAMERMARRRAASAAGAPGNGSNSTGAPGDGASAAAARARVQAASAEGGGSADRSEADEDGQTISPFSRRRDVFSLPAAPKAGGGTLIVTVEQDDPAAKALMAKCRSGEPVAEMTYSVSSDLSRSFAEFGPKPEGTPEYFKYKLGNVAIVDCPVAEGAPEQAFVLEYDNIEWLNWRPDHVKLPVRLEPASLKPLPKLSGITRTWVVSWIARANDVSDDQCPVMHEKPTEADYYAQMSPEEAEKERAKLAGQGGPNYQNGQMGLRGPNRLNVTYLPGIVPDPVMPAPKTRIARGLNLDGDDGKRRKHVNYVSEDGKLTGIDNQLYTTEGCIAGWQGHNGFIFQFANNQMRDGEMSILLQVSGIDNEVNDDDVYLTVYYSKDPMAKNAAGSMILADYSFSVTDEIEYTHHFSRFKARIVDGVIETERVKNFRMGIGRYGTPPNLKLEDAGMRLELQPGGGLKGVLGGYIDWRMIASTNKGSIAEFYHGFQQPALYNALKRNADGMKDPHTGEYRGISTAYDIEAVPAFISQPPERIAVAKEATASTN